MNAATRWLGAIVFGATLVGANHTHAMIGNVGANFSLSPFPSINTNSREGQNTSLRISAREGRMKEVIRLIELGADVNGAGEFGETALMYAARYNQVPVVEYLLSHDADPNLRDSRNETALMKASANCSRHLSGALIKAGAHVNDVNSEGRSALIIAAENGCAAIVSQLLAVREINVNAQDDSGRTALDHALLEAQTEVGGPYTDIAGELRRRGAKAISFTEIRDSQERRAPALP